MQPSALETSVDWVAHSSQTICGSGTCRLESEQPAASMNTTTASPIVACSEQIATSVPCTTASVDFTRFSLEQVEATVYAVAESKASVAVPAQLSVQVAEALSCLEKAIAKYGISGIALSFNGGKDCTVLLHLWTAAVMRYTRRQQPANPPDSAASVEDMLQSLLAPAIYVHACEPFPEVDAFTERMAQACCTRVQRECGPMRAGLDRFLRTNPQVQAVLVGIRRTDPFAATLETFQRTDPGWPDFMRIHPILDWNYADIWTYLRYFQVPYCILYDQGYTSLGGVNNTHPNPALKSSAADGSELFLPAWMLENGAEERLGRT